MNSQSEIFTLLLLETITFPVGRAGGQSKNQQSVNVFLETVPARVVELTSGMVSITVM